MTPAGGGTGRLRHLDGLRAVLAGYVELHHPLLTVSAATAGPGADLPGPDRTRPDLPVTSGRAA